MDTHEETGPLQSFSYDDDIVRKFAAATIIFGIVGMLVGVIIAAQLVLPALNFDTSFLSFGRLRPLHTNAVIFAFAGNAIFAAIYYSSQRLLKTRMWSDLLSRIHFWGWQLIIVAAAISLPLGMTSGKEYAELEWPIDIAITLVWVVFALNYFMTLATRRERHLYVAIWFYLATIIAIALLHIFNSLAIPVSATKGYSIYAGVQDAFMQWWYGHNAVAFFLTTPFLGLMYYFLPKAAERPVFSYRLSILHFWAIVFIYIWAGPHHLHYTAVPAWMSTLGMLFSVMLWMPSWGGMLNGLLTLRGAWNRVAEDPILKFYVVGITFYGMSTFEGPLLSIKSVNGLSHYTDWTIAHVHAGALGWVGFMIFGMLYWLAPRIFQTSSIYSRRLMSMHFWISTVGILLYIIPIYAAGLTQGLMWRAFEASGALKYGDFIETVTRLMPFYWLRLVGGTLFLFGTILCAYNLAATWAMRRRPYETTVHTAPALAGKFVDPPLPPSRLKGVLDFGHKLDVFVQARWHRHWERLPLKLTLWIAAGVIVASLFEIIPTFVLKSNIPTLPQVTPYTPLELAGRDIYIAEGCVNCHSQMIRPMRHETERYGDYSLAGEFVYDHPFLWGSRRIGPDLHRIGQRNTSVAWHVRHLNRPTDTSPNSIMPAYPWLLDEALDFAGIEAKVRAMSKLGAPYEKELGQSADLAHLQAAEIMQRLIGEDPSFAQSGLQDKKIVALTAYLLRLGTDLNKTAVAADDAAAPAVVGLAAPAPTGATP